MEYFEPAPELKNHLRRYWFINALNEGLPAKGWQIRPRGGALMIFNLGAPVLCGVDGRLPQAIEGDFLVGSLAGRVRLVPQNGAHLFGVEFQPCGLYPFLSMPPVDVADFCIQFEEVWELYGLGLSKLIHRASPDPHSRIRAFESFITKRMAEFRRHSALVDEAVGLIRASRGSVKVGKLSRELRVSSRHLERKFAYRIGVSPKQLCRIVRLKNVLSGLGSSGRGLACLALENGYCDQAHFIHEFRHFTGKAPLAYLQGH